MKEIRCMYVEFSHRAFQARIQAKCDPPQNFPVSRLYPMFSRFSQRFPDFLLTKFFKVRKCKRCGSLNPRLRSTKNDRILKRAIRIRLGY